MSNRDGSARDLEVASGGAVPRPTFDDVYSDHSAFVWRTLLRLGVPAAYVADATQEVFIVVHRRLASFEARSSVKSWVFGIAQLVAIEWIRRVRRRRTEELAGDVVDETRLDPLDGAIQRQAVERLYALLAGLSPDKRAVFVLAELEQMTVPEIAEAVAANVHTVTSRLKVARQEFDGALHRQRLRDARRSPWSHN